MVYNFFLYPKIFYCQAVVMGGWVTGSALDTHNENQCKVIVLDLVDSLLT